MFCYESSLNGFYEPRRASPDGCNIDDAKTLNNLLRVSTFYTPDPKYLELKQENGFTVSMRRELTAWMLGISDVCEDGVLSHAVSLLDRYLSTQKVERPIEELQVLGVTCLFVASKLRESTPLSVDGLVECGEHSYTIRDVRHWELRILNVLNWDTSAVLPHDLLDHFLHRLPIPDPVLGRVTGHARTLLNLACTEYNFLPHSSKIMAAGCLYDAVFALGSRFIELRQQIIQLMGKFVEIDQEELEVVISKIRQLIEKSRPSSSSQEGEGEEEETKKGASNLETLTPTNIEELCT